jgi:hypothetical protein
MPCFVCMVFLCAGLEPSTVARLGSDPQASRTLRAGVCWCVCVCGGGAIYACNRQVALPSQQGWGPLQEPAVCDCRLVCILQVKYEGVTFLTVGHRWEKDAASAADFTTVR